MNPLGYIALGLVRIVTGTGRMAWTRHRRKLERISQKSPSPEERYRARQALAADDRNQAISWGLLFFGVAFALFVILLWPIALPLIGIWFLLKLVGFLMHL